MNAIIYKYFLFILIGFLIGDGNLFAQSKKIKVAAIGNSVTYGAGIIQPQTNSYPGQLQQLLGNEYEVGNFGKSGATLLKMGHNPYHKTEEFKKAVNFKADIAIIHLGLNDTDPRNWPNYKDNFVGDYTWLIDTLKKNNASIKIYICKLSPIFSSHRRFLSGTFDWYWQIQEKIPKIARANDVDIIDFHHPLYSRPDLLPDALHPNKEGAGILAKVVYERITGDYGVLQIPEIFQSNMVLQRNRPIPFWGKANANAEVSVHFNSQTRHIKTDSEGNWEVEFPKMTAGGPYDLNIESGQKRYEFTNILVGDVWLSSGQSNMYFPLGQTENGIVESKNAINHSNIRLFKFKPLAETNDVSWDSTTLSKINKLEYFSGEWKENSEQSAKEFSAITYHFGKIIQAEENVPIGLIEMAVGGSPLISWIDRYSIESDPLLVNTFHDWLKSDFIQDWCRERAKKNLDLAGNNNRHPYQPAYNYESGISKLIQTPIMGLLWYQGESDANNLELHEREFALFIKSWRGKWQFEFPVYYVQLSSINRPSWPYFRDSQRRLQETIPNIHMAVSSDLGHATDVHPKQKSEIGSRLARLALKYTYRKNILADGPLPRKVTQAGSRITIDFKNAKKLQAKDNGSLKGLELKTDKGEFLSVPAVIKGSKILINIPNNKIVTEIVYGWEPFTHGNLVNEGNLPASTFKLNLN